MAYDNRPEKFATTSALPTQPRDDSDAYELIIPTMYQDSESFSAEKQHFPYPTPPASRTASTDSSAPQATPSNFVRGYPRLAYRMAQSPQSAIFRRFAALNTQNLLYYQAELQSLEAELRRLEIADAAAQGVGPEVKMRNKFAKDWYWLDESKELDGELGEQARLFEKIRVKLKEYSKFGIPLCLSVSRLW